MSEPGNIETDNAVARSHVRGSSLLLAGRMIALAINFCVQILIVRYLSKEGYGAFAYGYSIAMLGARMTPLGTEKAISRFVPIYHEANDLSRVKGSLMVVTMTVVIMGFLLVGFTFAMRDALSSTVVQDPLALSVLLMVIALAPLHAMENVLEKVLAIFGRAKLLFMRRYVITPVLRLVAVCSLLAVGGEAVYLAAAYVVTTGIGVLITGHILWRVLRKDQLLSELATIKATLPTKRLLGFGVPLLSSDVVFGLRTSLVVVLLEIFHGTVGVAAFRAILPVARLNQVVFDSFRVLYVPTASRMFARGDEAEISRLYWTSSAWIALLTFPVLLVSFSFATPAVVLLFGQDYVSSGPVLAVVALALYLNAAFGFNTLTLQVFDRVGTIMRIDLASGLLALVLNVAIVPFYGPLGGAAVICVVLIAQNLAYQTVLLKAGQLTWVPPQIAKIHGIVFVLAVALLAVQLRFTPPLYVGLLLIVVTTGLVWATCLKTLQIRELFPELDRLLPRRFSLTTEQVGR
ncbi:oligosaccharide flippase family protein [Roseimaritima ulvae]|uniref:Polysaccharide biosynthesis protein n=1 Tax=Roseimaritima ulvae TaxID=980254 RepID=A0A5B9QS71_9BACT|nr:oligosaccharide flippase family protein [Roseimaritima ulvae]QEG41898.1 Polysaccharide biosynthesis protein [Roseimaritima ulvae]